VLGFSSPVESSRSKDTSEIICVNKQVLKKGKEFRETITAKASPPEPLRSFRVLDAV
jgi:hypothetical protein